MIHRLQAVTVFVLFCLIVLIQLLGFCIFSKVILRGSRRYPEFQTHQSKRGGDLKMLFYCQWKNWRQRTKWIPVMRALASSRTLRSSLCMCFQLWILPSCFSNRGRTVRTLLGFSSFSTPDLCGLSLVIRVWVRTCCFYYLWGLFSFWLLKIFLFHYFLLNWFLIFTSFNIDFYFILQFVYCFY